MMGDHHGRTAVRATLLVRAVDDILGTHRSTAGAYFAASFTLRTISKGAER
jgi:hypothetical protein